MTWLRAQWTKVVAACAAMLAAIGGLTWWRSRKDSQDSKRRAKAAREEFERLKHARQGVDRAAKRVDKKIESLDAEIAEQKARVADATQPKEPPTPEDLEKELRRLLGKRR